MDGCLSCSAQSARRTGHDERGEERCVQSKHAQRRRRRRRGAERGREGQRGGRYSVARERPEQRHCPPASLHALAHKHSSAQTAQTAQTPAGQGSVRTPKGRRQRQQRATGRERRRLSMVITQKGLLTFRSPFRAHESPPSLLPLDLFTENGLCTLHKKAPAGPRCSTNCISADARQISRRHCRACSPADEVTPGKRKSAAHLQITLSPH